MLSPDFIYVGSAIAFLGDASYIRDTVRRLTQPNRVSWLMWGIATTLIGVSEARQGIGTACLLSFAIGIGDLLIFAVSFLRGNGVWKLGTFDFACGVASALGLIMWAATNNNTAALLAFIVADVFATMPTLAKSWAAPQSESLSAYGATAVSSLLVIATLTCYTTASLAFPLWLVCINGILVTLISSKVGLKFRHARALPRT